MPAEAFNQPVVFRPVVYTLSPQGGPTPTDGPSYPYMASVQPMSGRSVESKAGTVGQMPQSATRYDVLLQWADDPVIKAIAFGDTFEWRDKELSVITPPKDSGGLEVIWRIPCEVVEANG
ncbi:hypothetical protein V5E97_06760 [Singulisphaera sp. Ch08]|uniref:Phage tail protein n=1 Tax=Singulisphaera sp. Ch08 TaxID=3120278 RepID=A0AAU7CJY6_9BACT